MPQPLVKAILLVLAVLAWGTAFVVAIAKDGWPIAAFAAVTLAAAEVVAWGVRR